MAALRPVQQRRRLTEAVHDQLLEAIVTGEIRPGERLAEEDIARRLGVSTTPVREALQWLENDGLVLREPFRGARVRVPDAKHIQDVYEVRIGLEKTAIRLACLRADEAGLEALRRIQREGLELIRGPDLKAYAVYNERFHEQILTMAGNDILRRMLAQVHHLVRWFASMTVQMPGQRQRAFQEHEQMVEAIRTGDSTRATDIMELHLTQAMERLLAEGPWNRP